MNVRISKQQWQGFLAKQVQSNISVALFIIAPVGFSPKESVKVSASYISLGITC